MTKIKQKLYYTILYCIESNFINTKKYLKKTELTGIIPK